MIRDKSVIMCGMGGGIGVCLAPALEALLPAYPTVPWIDTIIPAPWNKTSVFVPIVVGGASLAGGLFLENHQAQPFLFGLGITALTSGFLKGIFSMQLGGRARTPLRVNRQMVRRPRPLVQQMQRNKLHVTPTGVSDKVIVA